MNRMTLAVATGFVAGCTVVAISAQTPSTERSNAEQDLKKNTVTVIGCVAGEAGHYSLTNATMKPGPTSTTGTAGSLSSQDSQTGHNGELGMMYDLKGAEDLKQHVGHKVEVTGTSSPVMKNDDDRSSTERSAQSHATLTATSVKMLSTTCP